MFLISPVAPHVTLESFSRCQSRLSAGQRAREAAFSLTSSPTPHRLVRVQPILLHSEKKLTIWHSHPPHAAICQLRRGERGARVWTPLSSSPFVLLNLSLAVCFFFFPFLFSDYFCHVSCAQPSATPRTAARRDCLKMRAVIAIFKR